MLTRCKNSTHSLTGTDSPLGQPAGAAAAAESVVTLMILMMMMMMITRNEVADMSVACLSVCD